jgi:hypothetical protein
MLEVWSMPRARERRGGVYTAGAIHNRILEEQHTTGSHSTLVTG